MESSSSTPPAAVGPCPTCGSTVSFATAADGEAECPNCRARLRLCRWDERWHFRPAASASLVEDITHMICEHLGANPQQVKRATTFEGDLGADSLDLVELMMRFEEKFNITIPDEQAQQIRTVGDAIDYVAGRIEEGGGGKG